jgi:hypothetical protein
VDRKTFNENGEKEMADVNPVGSSPAAASQTTTQLGNQQMARLQRRSRWISFFVQSATAKQAAQGITDPTVRAAVIANTDNAINQAIDDYCGTGTGSIVNPRPWPGPPSAVFSLVSQLVVVANTFQGDFLRNEVLKIAGKLMNTAVTLQINAGGGGGIGGGDQK